MIRNLFALLAAIVALLPGAMPTVGAELSIVSMHYSKSKPVPHLRYDGDTVAGDLSVLRSIYESFVHCGTECAPAEGRPNAVLTMNGPGGDYYEGLALADFLRANNIATIVEKGAYCYSACAFAFLGGTAYSSDKSIGSYVDRTIEPGGLLGFHAPYRNEESIRSALLERSPGDLLAESRGSLSLMVKELVRWNVDPEIIHHMVNQGPDDLYLVTKPEAYFLTRTALPPIPSRSWMADVPSAVRNACIRLLALFERTDPAELAQRITTPYETAIGRGENGGTVSGYRLSHGSLDIGFCAATDASLAQGSDLDVALYLNPLQAGGNSLAVLRFFNQDGWFSTADIGASPLKRIFQRGGIGHWFLPIGEDLTTAEHAGANLLTIADRFFSVSMPDLPPLQPGFTVDVTAPRSRVSHNGSVWLFEQVGSTDLYDAALRVSGDGVALTHDSVLADAFVRDGTHGDGTYFSLVGFRAATSSFVQRIMVLNGGQPLSDAERTVLGQVNCGVSFSGLRLIC